MYARLCLPEPTLIRPVRVRQRTMTMACVRLENSRDGTDPGVFQCDHELGNGIGLERLGRVGKDKDFILCCTDRSIERRRFAAGWISSHDRNSRIKTADLVNRLLAARGVYCYHELE